MGFLSPTLLGLVLEEERVIRTWLNTAFMFEIMPPGLRLPLHDQPREVVLQPFSKAARADSNQILDPPSRTRDSEGMT